MKKQIVTTLLLGVALLARADVPGIITYQGRVTAHGTNFTGLGQFKFSLVHTSVFTLITWWSQDGLETPNTIVSVPVTNGLFTVALGDTSLAGMLNSIPASVFDNTNVRLRIWFNDGATGFAQLAPDQRLTPAGYALRAANVTDGAITGAQLAPGFWNATNFPPNSVASAQLADTLALGATNASGRLDIYRTASNTPAISLVGSLSRISTFSSDGQEVTRLYGTGYGELLLNNGQANNATAVRLSSQGAAGQLELRNTNGSNRAVLEGETAGGTLALYQADGNTGAVLYGNEGQGSGALSLRNTSGNPRLRAYGGPDSGSLEIYDDDGTATVKLFGAQPGATGSRLELYQGSGGSATVVLDGEVGTGGGGYLQLRNGAGTGTITLDSDFSGEGRITTQVLEITGGADLSENFDIQSPDARPGMIVRIDPAHPGELAVSTRAYDRTVAGVVSGAGGVKPGMLMGQRNSKADGQHPVALTGRVYCLVDASAGAIAPGDLITTSDTAGHGMKVTDHVRAQGAIIGKAMTGLARGKGLVLVLVSLQ